jgi:hypothetical protein
MFSNIGRRLFPASFCTILISLVAASSAHAISLTLSWTGTGGNTVTGSLTGTDINSNGIIDGTFGLNEWTGPSSFTFTDNATPNSINYTVTELLDFGAYYGSGNGFRFNYNLAIGTVEQTGDPSTGVGLSIGDLRITGAGYGLESSTGILQFSDTINFTGNDSGGTLTATAVPFEFDGSAGMAIVGGVFVLNRWYKKRKSSVK